jgi:hypothetical protein
MTRWAGMVAVALTVSSWLEGGSAAAKPVQAAPVQVEVAGAGEVMAHDVGEAKVLPGNLAGVAGVTSPVLIRPGHRITGEYCRQFGFSFRAINLPAGQVVPIEVQVVHPLWTLPDGRTGTQENWTSVLDGNHWGYVGYAFTESWSLQPGTWTFTLSQGGRMLTQQSFELEVEPGQTLPPDGCTPTIS